MAQLFNIPHSLSARLRKNQVMVIPTRRERSGSHFILTSERNGLVIHRDQVRFLRCAGRYVYQERYHTFLIEEPTPKCKV